MPMPLTFNGTGIVLIFWERRFFASQILFIKVTLQPESKHTKVLKSLIANKTARSKMIKVVVYLQLLNTRPESRADNLAIEQKIDLVEKGSESASTKATLSGTLYPDLICL